MPLSPELLVGAGGGFVFAAVVAWALWKAHREDDADLRKERDAWKQRSESSETRLDRMSKLLARAKDES